MKVISTSATLVFGLSLLFSSAFWEGACAEPSQPQTEDSSLIQEKVSDFNNEISAPASPEQSTPLPEKGRTQTVILEQPIHTEIMPLVPDEAQGSKKERPKTDAEKKQETPVAIQDTYVPYFGGSPIIVEEEGMTPKPKKVAQAPVQKLKKGEHIQIPAEAAKRHDLSFLSGCWDTDASWGSFWEGGGRYPIRKKFCFDKSGRGFKVISAQGATYRGPARATFRGESLHIEAGNIHAPGRRDYFTPETAECRGTGKSTRCSSIFVNPDNHRQVSRGNYHLYRN